MQIYAAIRIALDRLTIHLSKFITEKNAGLAAVNRESFLFQIIGNSSHFAISNPQVKTDFLGRFTRPESRDNFILITGKTFQQLILLTNFHVFIQHSLVFLTQSLISCNWCLSQPIAAVLLDKA